MNANGDADGTIATTAGLPVPGFDRFHDFQSAPSRVGSVSKARQGWAKKCHQPVAQIFVYRSVIGENRLAQVVKQIAQHADYNVWRLSRRMRGKAYHVGKQNSGGLTACEGKWSTNANKLVDNFGREEASEVCSLPLNFLDAQVCRNVPEHKDSGNQDRNQAHRRPQRGGSIHRKSVHKHIAEDRKKCARDARDKNAAAMKVMSGNQNNNHVQGSYRKLEGRQRVDEKNSA